MRKLVTLILCLGVLLSIGTISAPTALADGTCTIHSAPVSSWSIQGDWVTSHWDFKCGGAGNYNWYVQIGLQWRDSSGSWHWYTLNDGQNANFYYPGGSHTFSGSFSGGDEHTGNTTFNVGSNIDCDFLRVHADVTFLNSNYVLYNDTQQIGC